MAILFEFEGVIKVKVLMATGDPHLDEAVSRHVDCSAGPCCHRHVLAAVAAESSADTVVLGASLPGGDDLVELVWQLRVAGLRLVLLPGDRNNQATRELMRQVVPMGVYDFVYDPVDAPKVVARLRCLATLGSLEAEFAREAVRARDMARRIIPDVPPAGKKGAAVQPGYTDADDGDIPPVGDMLSQELGVIMDQEAYDTLVRLRRSGRLNPCGTA